nr:AAA family ATPase [Streptomyces sp. SID5910]
MSVDEEVHRLHGRYGVDYPEWERPVVAAIRQRLVKELQAGNDVVLDHGLWRRSERDSWRQAARVVGGHPLVVHLPADRDELPRRLTERNRREDANALTVTPEALDDFFARFDIPTEDEDVIVHTGSIDVLLAMLTSERQS